MVPESMTRGLRHAALFYDTDQSFQKRAITFLREGTERGELALIHTGGLPGADGLREAFSDDAAMRFEEPSGYVSPVAVLDQFRRTMDSALARGVQAFRVIRSYDLSSVPVHWLEWLRFEAVVNRSLARYPLTVLCPYDTRIVEQERASAIRRAHPELVGSESWQSNDGYVDPAELVSLPEYALPADQLQLTPPQMVLDDVGDLRDLRIDLYPPLLPSALSRKKVDDFVKAVGEVVVNAHEHGVGRVELRLWSGPTRVVCTVVDQGAGIGDPFAGYSKPVASLRAGSTHEGLGLWAARQLCDTLDYDRTDEGFTVRLTMAV